MALHPDVRDSVDLIEPGASGVEAEPLLGGSSAFVAMVRFESATGTEHKVVFRQHRDRASKGHSAIVAAKEFELTGELFAMGFPVAKPLAVSAGGSKDGPWLLSEWVDGSSAVADGEVDHALLQLAEFIAHLHAITPAEISTTTLDEIEDPAEVLHGYLPDDDVGQRIERVLDVGLDRRRNPDRLIHGDFWPGNVLFGDGELVAVIDWEDATWGDPLADLACARVELTCAFGANAAATFTDRYLDLVTKSRTPIMTEDLPLWDAYVSATALSSMHRWGLSAVDEAERRRTTARFLDDAGSRLIAAQP